MPKPKPADSVALYEALVATQPGLERKGATMPYTSVDGNMFSFLTPDGTLALRLPEADRVAFQKRHQSKPVEQHGVVLQEYVRVSPELLQETRLLAKHLAASYAYAQSLKPKATTRKAAKAKPPSRKKAR